MRRTVIAGNWKMHKNSDESRAFIRDLRKKVDEDPPECEMIIAPPFTSIEAICEEAKGSGIQVAGQNMHWEKGGAFTGEVSAGMLKDAGCGFVIIGHSERRQFFGDTDDTVNRKMIAARRVGLVPIFCVGERLEEREEGKAFEVVQRQIVQGIIDVKVESPLDIMVAYEPVWAIGTGKSASPDQALEIHTFIRKELADILSSDISQGIRILYGGSVKPSNIKGLLQCEDIDGALIGGASLKSQEFADIISAAS